MRDVKQSEAYAVKRLIESEAWKIVEALIDEDLVVPMEDKVLGGALSHDEYLRYTGHLAGIANVTRKVKAFASNARESSA